MSSRNAFYLPGTGDVGEGTTRFETVDTFNENRCEPFGIHMVATGHCNTDQGEFRHWSAQRDNFRFLISPFSGVFFSLVQIHRYFETLPEEKVPKIDSIGERYREKQIAYQLPKQDLALSYCKHIEPQHNASYEDFVTARNELALDIGYVTDATVTTNCVECDGKIQSSDMAVIAPKFRDEVSLFVLIKILHTIQFARNRTSFAIFSCVFPLFPFPFPFSDNSLNQMLWHPNCFTCTTCEELLVDLTYCVHDDKIYCERHYAEVLKPRCNACDEVSHSIPFQSTIHTYSLLCISCIEMQAIETSIWN